MKLLTLLKQVREDFKKEFGSDIPGLKELVAGLLPAPLARYRSFRILALVVAALVAALLLVAVWAGSGSLAFALIVVVGTFAWVISYYLQERGKRRKAAVNIPIEYGIAVCKDAAGLKLPVDLVDVLGLELNGWYTPHNNFFSRWPWVGFSIPIDTTTSVNLSDPSILENTLFLLNLYAATFCKKMQSPPLVIRNLRFSRNSLEFEIVLDAGRDAREFLAETSDNPTLAGIDDPDFGAPPKERGRGDGR